MILVDTSVWIDYFRGVVTPQSDKLDALLGVEQVLTGDLILTEVLQGFVSDRDFNQARKLLASVPLVPLVGEDIAFQAARNFRKLRTLGITIRKTNTEPYGSVFPDPLRCLVRRALGRHPTRRSGAARACGRFDHGPCREVPHDPHGHEEACRRLGAGGARHHGEGRARADLQARPAPDWRKRRHGSRGTASSGTHASTSWTRLSRN
jgi:predicted nucleic acid-binding protein